MSMTPTFDLPRSFDPLEFLSGPMLLRADHARWLVSTILRKTAHRDLDVWGCARLHSDVLYRVLGNHAGKIVKALAAGVAIETMPYRPGVRTKGYRLAQRYLGDRCVRRPCTDRRLRDRLERERERMQEQADDARAKWAPIHHALDHEQHRLTITSEANAILDTLPDHTRLCQDVLTTRIRRREFPYKVSTAGRAFNAVTGLKRELRATLRIGGESLGSVDLAAAQPTLLGFAMTHGTHGTPANGVKGRETYKVVPPTPLPLPCCPLPAAPAPDSRRFVDLACSGGFYERLMDLTDLDRDTVKKRFLVDVLAKRGRYPSTVERAFRREFPSVYSFVRKVNRQDYAELIRLLQGLESWLVIHQVAPRLVGRVPCVTLHDAIFSQVGELDEVERAFLEAFKALDFTMALKREGAT